jgi:pyruvate/2-oxoglutarate dehydrogenase complex dihydrolipoamide dehydrogenase (E3) component
MIVIGSGPAGKRTAIQATKLDNSDLEKINFWLLVN